MWNSEALFVYAHVTDPRRTAPRGEPGSWWKGDSVSFEVGPDPRGLSPSAPLRKARDFHVILAYRPAIPDGAEAAINPVGEERTGPVFIAGRRAPGVTVVARRTDVGYDLEAKVPWSQIGWSVPPQRGEVIGFNLNVSDADPTGTALRSMRSSNPDRSRENQPHPGTWQTLALGDAE
jgi:hypothetical protein